LKNLRSARAIAAGVPSIQQGARIRFGDCRIDAPQARDELKIFQGVSFVVDHRLVGHQAVICLAASGRRNVSQFIVKRSGIGEAPGAMIRRYVENRTSMPWAPHVSTIAIQQTN
jgi:hypothetical protein